MHEIYSTITRQMILNIIKEMTSGINLASAKPVDLLVSITLQFLSFSLQFHILHLFSLSFFLVYTFVAYCQPNMHHHLDARSLKFRLDAFLSASYARVSCEYNARRQNLNYFVKAWDHQHFARSLV